MLPVSLDCPSLIALSVLSNVYFLVITRILSRVEHRSNWIGVRVIGA
jgi:hypothetical protein